MEKRRKLTKYQHRILAAIGGGDALCEERHPEFAHRFFLRNSGKEIAERSALDLIARGAVTPLNDSLFPGDTQSWGLPAAESVAA